MATETPGGGGEGDAASVSGSSEGSAEPPAAPPGPAAAAAPPVNVSPGVKLVIGDDADTMKSVSAVNSVK